MNNTSANADKLYALYTSLKAAETLDQVSALLLAANESALLRANERAFFQEMAKRYFLVGPQTYQCRATGTGQAGDPVTFISTPVLVTPNEAIATTIFAHYRLARTLIMRTNKKELLA